MITKDQVRSAQERAAQMLAQAGITITPEERRNIEVAAVQDGEIAQKHVAAIAQRDRLVAAAGPAVLISLLAFHLVGEALKAAVQTTAVNPAGTENGHVLEGDAPDEAVLPVAVTVVLIMKLVAQSFGSGRS